MVWCVREATFSRIWDRKANFDAHPTRGRGRWVAAAPMGRCYVSPSATDPRSDFANMCYNSGRRKPHLTPASSGRASVRAAGGGALIGTRRSVRAARPVAQGTAQRVRLPSPPRLRRPITQGGDTAREARTIRSAAMRDACTPGTHRGAPPSQPECACRIARPGTVGWVHGMCQYLLDRYGHRNVSIPVRQIRSAIYAAAR